MPGILTDLLTTNASGTNVFKEHYDLNPDGTKNDVIDTRYTSTGGIFSQTTMNWTYDALDRLTDETLTVQSGGSNAPSPGTALNQASNKSDLLWRQ